MTPKYPLLINIFNKTVMTHLQFWLHLHLTTFTDRLPCCRWDDVYFRLHVICHYLTAVHVCYDVACHVSGPEIIFSVTWAAVEKKAGPVQVHKDIFMMVLTPIMHLFLYFLYFYILQLLGLLATWFQIYQIFILYLLHLFITINTCITISAIFLYVCTTRLGFVFMEPITAILRSE